MIQNLSIQVVPINCKDAYAKIDSAIEIIEKSGLNYKVTAFNTQVEGELEALQCLIKDIQHQLFSSGTEELLLNIQFHAKNGKDVFLDEKA